MVEDLKCLTQMKINRAAAELVFEVWCRLNLNFASSDSTFDVAIGKDHRWTASCGNKWKSKTLLSTINIARKQLENKEGQSVSEYILCLLVYIKTL